MRFPEGFIWGVATAAYQIEGAAREDGRGESIWDRFSRTPGNTVNRDTGDLACDHYHRFESDIDLMAELGYKGYRFSVSWPRIQPSGKGAVNQKGLDFYRRLVARLNEKGILPAPTLYHWDLPQALQDEGGWLSRDTAHRFAEYARILFEALGDQVPLWITHNEPWCSSMLGHFRGVHAPGFKDLRMGLAASHHMLLSHGLAVAEYRSLRLTGQIGIAPNLLPTYPLTDSEANRAAARLSDGYTNRWFLDPVLRGTYPKDMLDHYERLTGPLDFIRPGDLDAMGSPCDFLGVNYYRRRTIEADPAADLGWKVHDRLPGVPTTSTGSEIVPQGLTDLLQRLKREYGDVPVYITENGMVHPDRIGDDGQVHDPERVEFLRLHVQAVGRALAEGVNVRGFFAWSFLDNFEYDARNSYAEAMAIGGRHLNNALQSLSWQIEIPHAGGMKPIVVFNPLTWPVRQNVELEFGGLKETDILIDEQGQQVPMQVVRSHATVTSWRKRITFTADLPSLGYRTFRVLTQPQQVTLNPLAASDTVLENERFRLEIDPETGCIRSLLDKRLTFEVFRGAAARAEVLHDPTDTWSHGETIFHQVVGAFAARRVRLIEHGPVKAVIRVENCYGESSLIQDFTMYRDLDRIDVRVEVDWREQFKVLKLRFPTNLHFPKATFETAYGSIDRAVNGEEDLGQNWIDLSGTIKERNVRYGLSLLNDGKYSFSVKEKEMSLTVLRSPIYAHHDPYVPRAEGRYVFMDQGLQRFTYSLVPHEGGWEQAQTPRRGWELNQQPVSIIETYHKGSLPLTESFLSVDQPNIIVHVLKQHEESEDLILRAYETDKAATRVTIRLPRMGRSFDSSFGRCEIKTFRIPLDPDLPVTETNLLEWQ